MSFLTVPGYRNKSGQIFYPARPGIDFSPMNGQFIFQHNSNRTHLNFTIFSSDDWYILNSDKMFIVVLLNVANCDTCQIGSNREAYVYLRYVKPSVVSWNTGMYGFFFLYIKILKIVKNSGFRSLFISISNLIF